MARAWGPQNLTCWVLHFFSKWVSRYRAGLVSSGKLGDQRGGAGHSARDSGHIARDVHRARCGPHCRGVGTSRAVSLHRARRGPAAHPETALFVVSGGGFCVYTCVRHERAACLAAHALQGAPAGRRRAAPRAARCCHGTCEAGCMYGLPCALWLCCHPLKTRAAAANACIHTTPPFTTITWSADAPRA